MKNQKKLVIFFLALSLIGLACTNLVGQTMELPQFSTDAQDVPTQPAPTIKPIDPYWLSLEEMPVYGGIFNGEHCDPICAMGFRPFESTLSDFRLFIEAYPELDCSKSNYPYRYGRCFSDNWRLDLDFNPYTEIVESVAIKINDFTLGEFIQVYGEPTHYYMWVEEEYSQAWPIELFFPDSYVKLWLNDTYDFSELSKETGYRIGPDSAVHKIVFYSVEVSPMGFYEHIIPWQGYGIYFSDRKATEGF